MPTALPVTFCLTGLFVCTRAPMELVDNRKGTGQVRGRKQRMLSRWVKGAQTHVQFLATTRPSP